jgi:hypothetical protein
MGKNSQMKPFEREQRMKTARIKDNGIVILKEIYFKNVTLMRSLMTKFQRFEMAYSKDSSIVCTVAMILHCLLTC